MEFAQAASSDLLVPGISGIAQALLAGVDKPPLTEQDAPLPKNPNSANKNTEIPLSNATEYHSSIPNTKNPSSTPTTKTRSGTSTTKTPPTTPSITSSACAFTGAAPLCVGVGK